MHQIYRRAIRTVVWLGDAADNSHQAFRSINLNPHGDFAKYGSSDFDDIYATFPARTTLQNLMERPIWRRLWIMQEVVLSKEEPILYCGDESLSWSDLGRAVQVSAVSAPMFKQLFKTRERISKTDLQCLRSPQPHKLRHVLELSSGFETTEALDRIFALYGMLQVTGIGDLMSLRPNYELAVADVFRMVTWDAVRLEGGLNILQLLPHSQDPLLSSWVVDFSKTMSLRNPEIDPDLSSQELDWSVDDKRGYTRDSHPEPFLSGEMKGVLNVSGVIFDVVDKVY